MSELKPFDDVMLKDHTSVYRAYRLPEGHPRGPYIFVCLYADEIRYSDEVEVAKIIDDNNRTDSALVERLEGLVGTMQNEGEFRYADTLSIIIDDHKEGCRGKVA